MNRLRCIIRFLFVVTIGLPIVYLLFHLLAGLLRAMEDMHGAKVVLGLATACMVAWPMVLVGLLLAVAYLICQQEYSQHEPPEDHDRD